MRFNNVTPDEEYRLTGAVTGENLVRLMNFSDEVKDAIQSANDKIENAEVNLLDSDFLDGTICALYKLSTDTPLEMLHDDLMNIISEVESLKKTLLYSIKECSSVLSESKDYLKIEL